MPIAASSSRARAGPDPMPPASAEKAGNEPSAGRLQQHTKHASQQQPPPIEATVRVQGAGRAPSGSPAAQCLSPLGTLRFLRGCKFWQRRREEPRSCARLRAGDAWKRHPAGWIQKTEVWFSSRNLNLQAERDAEPSSSGLPRPVRQPGTDGTEDCALCSGREPHRQRPNYL